MDQNRFLILNNCMIFLSKGLRICWQSLGQNQGLLSIGIWYVCILSFMSNFLFPYRLHSFSLPDKMLWCDAERFTHWELFKKEYTIMENVENVDDNNLGNEEGSDENTPLITTNDRPGLPKLLHKHKKKCGISLGTFIIILAIALATYFIYFHNR